MSVFTLADWNNIRTSANIKRQEAKDAGCHYPEVQLPLFSDPYVWARIDIAIVEAFLDEICPYAWSTIGNIWSFEKVNEIINRINSIIPCVDCP